MLVVSSNDSTFFFFNDTATTEIYTLSLHDALPISIRRPSTQRSCGPCGGSGECGPSSRWRDSLRLLLTSGPLRSFLSLDRKSTRLNSSHLVISYAVFCLKKKKKSKDYNRSCALPGR